MSSAPKSYGSGSLIPASLLDNRLTQAVRADPKKAGVLGVLVLAMAGLWARAWMSGDAGPQIAHAASQSVAPTAGGKDVTGNGAAIAEWSRGSIQPLGRNLFAVKLDYFPQDGARTVLRAPQGDGFWDQLAKSMASRADQQKERQWLLENLKLQAAQLRLHSVIMSATPAALINDALVGEGDVVGSFRVLKIESRRIIVEREGIKLEILMK